MWQCSCIIFASTACPPIRLIAGANNLEGRIEVYYQNQWGTVCDDLWDLNDANVACRQLGLGAATAALSFSTFGQGSGNIWLDNLRCGGTEDCLGNCTHNGWGVHNCAHFEDAGVRCTGVCIVYCLINILLVHFGVQILLFTNLKSSLLVEASQAKDELKSFIAIHGELSVIAFGISMMLKWCAVSLAMLV